MQNPKTRARQLKTAGAEPDNSSSQSPANRTPKATSLKIEKAKKHLSLSESWKKQTHEEAEDAKKQLAEMSEKLQDSQQQLDEISSSEESQSQELRKISQDRDRAWESELDAVQKHYSMDSAALAATVNELQKLTIQLDKLSFKSKLPGILSIVKETLRLEKLKAVEAYDSLMMEFENSKSQLNSLEGIVSKFQVNGRDDDGDHDDDHHQLNCVNTEVVKLYEEVDEVEKRYQEEYFLDNEEIRSAYELVQQTMSQSCQHIAILEAILKKSEAELEVWKAKLQEKEDELQNISKENKELNEKLDKSESTTVKDTEDVTEATKLADDLEEQKRVMGEKETELKNVTEESYARVAEIEADEAAPMLSGNNDRKFVQRTGFLGSHIIGEMKAANAELKAELRRMKELTDQWRKAAEDGAAMLSGNNDRNFLKRTRSLGSDIVGGKLNSPYCEDMEEVSPKKKNGNILKKFGVFMKKGQK